MKRIFQWRQAALALGVMFWNVASNVVATMIAESNWLYLTIFAVSAALAGLVYWFARQQSVDVLVRRIKPLRTNAERRQEAHRGLIAVVSLYQPGRNSTAAALKIKDRVKAAQEKDYAALDIPGSNLAVLADSILVHASRLEHCWLIATSSAEKAQASELYLPALIEYLRQEHGLTCQFHCGDDFYIPLEDDALVMSNSRELVNAIFRAARRLGLKETEIVADITSGMRSISLGIVLACLDGRRKVQFIGTHYDALGNFTGARFPILFDYEPTMVQE